MNASLKNLTEENDPPSMSFFFPRSLRLQTAPCEAPNLADQRIMLTTLFWQETRAIDQITTKNGTNA